MWAAGAFFTTYEGTKSVMEKNLPSAVPTPLVHAAASGTAELVSCFILTPAEVLKQNAQMVNKSSSTSGSLSTGNATLQAFKKFKKPSQLWRGYTALAARNLPFTGLQFPLFEALRTYIQDKRREKGLEKGGLWERGLVTAISAGAAGSVAAWVTTPIDVVKTRIMLSASSSSTPEASGKEGGVIGAVEALTKKRKSSWAIGADVVKENGVRGLWRGGLLRAVWTALGSGLYLGVYESGRYYLAERRGEKGYDGEMI
jgi:solute carrier family 25 (mitochondrial S-adenosylmethionine transporter), member 26